MSENSFVTNTLIAKNFCIVQLAAVRGKIYAIGGWDDNHEYLDTVEEYDTIRYVSRLINCEPSWT